jgi:hypothetical protein
MSEQEQTRAAWNQALYRQVNENIRPVNEAFAEVMQAESEWVCECANEECTEPLRMTLAEYEELRNHANRCAVLAGHLYPDVEHVVGRTDRYVLVEKIGKGGEIATETDPRK